MESLSNREHSPSWRAQAPSETSRAMNDLHLAGKGTLRKLLNITGYFQGYWFKLEPNSRPYPTAEHA